MIRKSIKWLAAAVSLLCIVSCTTDDGPEGPGQDGPGEDGQISCTYKLKDSTIFYGSPIMKLIRKVIVDNPALCFYYEYDFKYDSNGRLTKVLADYDGVWRFSYYDDRIVLCSEYNTVTSYLDENGRLVKTVDVYDSGDEFYTPEWNVSYDSDNNPVIPDYVFRDGNLIEYCGWKVYQYSEEPDNMNLDIFGLIILNGSYSWDDYVLDRYYIPFYSFPYIHNKNLCTGFTLHSDDGSTEHVNISYTYDNDGDVESITARGGDGKYVVRLYYD